MQSSQSGWLVVYPEKGTCRRPRCDTRRPGNGALRPLAECFRASRGGAHTPFQRDFLQRNAAWLDMRKAGRTYGGSYPLSIYCQSLAPNAMSCQHCENIQVGWTCDACGEVSAGEDHHNWSTCTGQCGELPACRTPCRELSGSAPDPVGRRINLRCCKPLGHWGPHIACGATHNLVIWPKTGVPQ